MSCDDVSKSWVAQIDTDKYPSVKTISEKFQRLSGGSPPATLGWRRCIMERKARRISNGSVDDSNIAISSFRTNVVNKKEKKEKTEKEEEKPKVEKKEEPPKPAVIPKLPLTKFLLSDRYGPQRSATDMTIERESLVQENNRLSTTFVIGLQTTRSEINTIDKPPSSLPPLPPPPPQIPVLGIEKITNTVDEDTKKIPQSARTDSLQSNTNRHAIRHRPSSGYISLFQPNQRTSEQEKTLKIVADTLKIDPRKPKSGLSNTTFIRQNSESKMKDKRKINHKRRSTLPLRIRLEDIGIEIPPVTLNIHLHEPNKEIRTVSRREHNNFHFQQLLINIFIDPS